MSKSGSQWYYPARSSSSGRYVAIRPWWSIAMGAVAWAIVIMGLYLLSVFFWPFDDWSRADQLALLQSAVGVAGVGAAGVAITLAATGPARPHGTPQIELVEFGDIVLRPNGDGNVHASVPIEIRNDGNAVPLSWQFEVQGSHEVDISAMNIPGAVLISRKRGIADVDHPLRNWATSVIGTVELEFSAEARRQLRDPLGGHWNVPYLEGSVSSRFVKFHVRSDLGEKAWEYPVSVAPQ